MIHLRLPSRPAVAPGVWIHPSQFGLVGLRSLLHLLGSSSGLSLALSHQFLVVLQLRLSRLPFTGLLPLLLSLALLSSFPGGERVRADEHPRLWVLKCPVEATDLRLHSLVNLRLGNERLLLEEHGLLLESLDLHLGLTCFAEELVSPVEEVELPVIDQLLEARLGSLQLVEDARVPLLLCLVESAQA